MSFKKQMKPKLFNEEYISYSQDLFFFHIFTHKKKQDVFSKLINLVILTLTSIKKRE